MRKDVEFKDIRVRKTIEAIQSSFRSLLKEKKYSELTVSGLCKEARIGRKTFYAYYESLDALLEELLEKLTLEYIERIKNYHVPENMREITREFYLFSIEQGMFYDNLVCSENSHALGSRLLRHFVRETWQSSPWFRAYRKEIQDMILCFIYNSGAGLYREWVMSGKKIPLDEMIMVADTLLSRGLEGLKI